MHVFGSQSEVLCISDIDTSNTEPPVDDTVDEQQLDGGQIDDDVCSPTTVYPRRKQVHRRKRGT